jgi:hypothetical protein
LVPYFGSFIENGNYNSFVNLSLNGKSIVISKAYHKSSRSNNGGVLVINSNGIPVERIG